MIRTFFVFCELAWVILHKNKQATNALFEELNSILRPHGLALTPEHKKRITFYTAQSAITNYWFSTLRGYKPNTAEVQHALYLGAFTPIADDLMDSTGQTFEALKQMQKTDTTDAILFDYLFSKLNPLLETNTLFAEYFKKAHEAQNRSLKQLQQEPLDLEELKTISFDKGGFYTTLYRMVLTNPPVPGEEKAIYLLGAILQILNDLFDIHKDYHNSVQTLATNTANIFYIKEILQELEADFKKVFFHLDYPTGQKQKSFIGIMAIVTRGHVALDYYGKLQGTIPQLNIGSYPRKTLIVDMEKLGNVWRNLRETKKAFDS